VWRLSRRSLSDPKQLAYYLAYAPPRTSWETLVRVASSRYTVEQCIAEAKGESGLDEYEVRFWHSWYRHITLSMFRRRKRLWARHSHYRRRALRRRARPRSHVHP
jgi:SRSO17 transposase